MRPWLRGFMAWVAAGIFAIGRVLPTMTAVVLEFAGRLAYAMGAGFIGAAMGFRSGAQGTWFWPILSLAVLATGLYFVVVTWKETPAWVKLVIFVVIAAGLMVFLRGRDAREELQW